MVQFEENGDAMVQVTFTIPKERLENDILTEISNLWIQVWQLDHDMLGLANKISHINSRIERLEDGA